MSQSTFLYLDGNRWGLKDIINIIKNKIVKNEKCKELNLKYKNPDFYTIEFYYKNIKIFGYIHVKVDTPLGKLMLLDFCYSKKSIEIMKIIAETIGGLLQPNDCEENNMEFIYGKLNEEDGLSYFLKYAVICNNNNGNDINNLKESIDIWKKTYEK